MKFLLACAAALVLSVTSTIAEDTPPPPANDPAPPGQQTDPAPAPKARKEDETDDDRQGLFAKFFDNAGKKKAARVSAENATLAEELATANTEVERLTVANERLTATVAQFNTEWPAIESALAAGQSDAPALQTPFGQQVSLAVNKSVTRAIAAAGHDPKDLPGPGANKPKSGHQPDAGDIKPLDKRERAAAAAQYWVSRNAPWAKVASN